MLWEATEARDALLGRFGFRDADQAAEWVRAVAAEHWGVHVSRCDRIVMSAGNALAWVRTREGRQILKWSVEEEKFARLADLSDLVSWLGEKGHPVAVPVRSLTGARQVEGEGWSANLQPVIDGDFLDTRSPEAVRNAGACLAALHGALRHYPQAEGMHGLSRPASTLHEQIDGWLADDHPGVDARALETLRSLMDRAPGEDGMPIQLVHGDFRASNVLSDGTTVTAVLDFEEARVDHPVAEVARSAVLLGTLFHDWGPVPRRTKEQFVAGYASVRPLSPQEQRWLPVLVTYYSLAFVPGADDPAGWGAAALELLGE